MTDTYIQDRPVGYTVGTIHEALRGLYGNAPTSQNIRKFVKGQNLGKPYNRLGGRQVLLVPESALGKIIEGMQLPVNLRDLSLKIEETPVL